MTVEATLIAESLAQSGHGRPLGTDGRDFLHSIHRNFEGLSSLRTEWDELVHSAGDDLFATYDWCRIWWKHYGQHRRLQVHVFKAEDQLVGVIPLFEERLCLGPCILNVARLVGCDHSVTTCGFACRPEFLNAAIVRVVRHLNSVGRWDVLHIGPLAGYSNYREDVAASLRGCPGVRQADESADDGPHILFHLPADFEAYLASLPSGERSNLRRREKKLKELNPKWEIAHGDDLDMHLRAFMEQHKEQWNREGKLGHFVDWPRSIAFHTELAHVLEPMGRLNLIRIDTDQGRLGYQYNYVFGRRIFWILGSRSTHSKWDAYSPGQRLHCATLRMGMAEGRTEIDAMRGMYEYKLRLGGVVRHLQSVTAVSARTGAALRFKAFRAVARVLNVIYYRLWYCRLASRFPHFQRPLWTLWIRSRL